MGHLLARKTMPGPEKMNRFIDWAAATAIGTAIALIQIIPAWEYVDLSYNRVWHVLSWLNERHPTYAWLSLFSVGLTDLYIRLVSMGIIRDLRIL